MVDIDELKSLFEEFEMLKVQNAQLWAQNIELNTKHINYRRYISKKYINKEKQNVVPRHHQDIEKYPLNCSEREQLAELKNINKTLRTCLEKLEFEHNKLKRNYSHLQENSKQ